MEEAAAHKAKEEAAKAEAEKATENKAKPESFKNCTEMRKVYPNGVPSDHPAYASKHDRNKDNWACVQS